MQCNITLCQDDDEQGDNDDDTAENIGNIQTKVSVNDVAAGKYQLIYANHEAFLSSRKGRKILHIKILHDHMCGISIDEAHMK